MKSVSIQDKNLYDYNNFYTKNSIAKSISSTKEVDSSKENKLTEKNEIDDTLPKACDVLTIDRENKITYLNGLKMDDKFMDLLCAGKDYNQIITTLKIKKNDNTDDEVLKRIINS